MNCPVADEDCLECEEGGDCVLGCTPLDPDCTPAAAQCVSLDAAMGKIGFIAPSPTAACPNGYTDMTVLWKGLMPGACSGCSCTPPAVTCSATVASFADAALCNSATNTGVPAGTAGVDGRYPDDSVNGRVQRRLDALYEKRRELAREARGSGAEAERPEAASE